MADRQFSESHLAALYDPLHGREGRDDLGFYLPLVMSGGNVLDVGCGTGALLHWAREQGHTGRLVGLDPAEGMLRVARRRSDIEWVLGDAASAERYRDFDLVVMTGHAFQVFVGDREIQTSLAAIHSALAGGGAFAFETRNPLARAWERWTPEHGTDFVDATGAVVRSEHEVEVPVAADVVRFTTTYTSDRWSRPETSRSTLRFLDREALSAFLTEAGFTIDEQFGDWDRSPLTPASPEIITIARRP